MCWSGCLMPDKIICKGFVCPGDSHKTHKRNKTAKTQFLDPKKKKQLDRSKRSDHYVAMDRIVGAIGLYILPCCIGRSLRYIYVQYAAGTAVQGMR